MPTAGDAFLTTSLPSQNNPLNRINYNPFKSVFDLEAFIEQLKTFVTDYLIPVIKDLTGIDLSFLAQIFDGIDLTSPGGVLAAVVNIVIELINRLLVPFGQNGVFGSLEEALNTLVQTFMSPIHTAGSLFEQIQEIWEQLGGQLASLQHQVNVLRLALDDGVDATGGYDDCSTLTHVYNVLGTVELTGWGAWDATDTAVWHDTRSPTSDRHGAGFVVKAKRPGVTILHICSDTAMTNWAGLQLTTTNSGDDTVSVVTGTGPNSGIVARTTLPMRVATGTKWEIYYEPYDETSETSNTFHVFLNRQPLTALRWPDDGNVVIHGSDHLRVGGTLNGLGDSSKRGMAVTEFAFDNWVGAAPQ